MTTPSRLLPAAGLAGAILCSVPLAGAMTSHAASSTAENPAAIINGFGGDLHQALAAASDDPNANLVFSPTSVGVALAMASAGAAGDTAAQMNDVLGFTAADPHTALGALVTGVEEHGSGSFSEANSLWTQDGLSIDPAFNDLLAGTYGAEMQTADFANDAAAALEDVNGWVADATDDRIPDLLTPEQVTDLTRFILVNAVHLDAEWLSPFDPTNTSPSEFMRGDGSSVETDFMGQTLFAGYSEGDDWQAIVLPYTAGYEMVVVLPAEGGLAGFEQALADAGGDLNAVLGGFAIVEVSLDLPTWDVETSADLVPQLQELGMTLPFTDAADFSNITTDEPLSISAVVHEANITVDEAGTEAAAATAAIGEVGAAPPGEEPEPEVMDVDHPFFFAIRDRSPARSCSRATSTTPRPEVSTGNRFGGCGGCPRGALARSPPRSWSDPASPVRPEHRGAADFGENSIGNLRLPIEASVGRALAELFGLAAALLRFDPAFLRRLRRLRRAARRGRGSDRVGDGGGQAVPCDLTVAELGPALGYRHRQHAVDQVTLEGAQGACPLGRRQGVRRRDVPRQLHPRVARVDVLTSRTTRTREPPFQLAAGNRCRGRHPEVVVGIVRHCTVLPSPRQSFSGPRSTWPGGGGR